MQQCLKRFVIKSPTEKWSLKEKTQLKQIVKSIRPKDNEGWTEVCLRMHALGSRKTQQQYRNRGINFLSNQHRLQIKLSDEKIDEILENFELGNSVKQLAKIYETFNISSQKIRNVLVQKFESMKNVIKKIVGISKIRPITVKDFNLFAFIRSRNEFLPSLIQVAQRCQRLKKASRSFDHSVKLEAAAIESYLERYNDLLRKYTYTFQQLQKERQDKLKSKPKNPRLKLYAEQQPKTSFRHLSSIVESLKTIQQQSTVESYDEFFDEKKFSDIGNQQTMADMSGLLDNENEWCLADIMSPQQGFAFCSIQNELEDESGEQAEEKEAEMEEDEMSFGNHSLFNLNIAL